MSIKTAYQEDVNAKIARWVNYKAPIVTEQMLEDLPTPVRRYITHCGYLGRELTFNAFMEYKNTYLKIWEGSEYAPVQAYLYTSAPDPRRLVYIFNKIFGFIPLAARSHYHDCQVETTARTLGIFPLTIPKGQEQNEAALADILGDFVLMPGLALQPSVQWIEINENTARAIMRQENLEVSGIFRFNDAGECIEYDTEDRSYTLKDTTTLKVRSTTRYEGYHQVDGLLQPSGLKQFWHLATGDFEYAKAEYVRIRHNVREPITLNR